MEVNDGEQVPPPPNPPPPPNDDEGEEEEGEEEEEEVDEDLEIGNAILDRDRRADIEARHDCILNEKVEPFRHLNGQDPRPQRAGLFRPVALSLREPEGDMMFRAASSSLQDESIGEPEPAPKARRHLDPALCQLQGGMTEKACEKKINNIIGRNECYYNKLATDKCDTPGARHAETITINRITHANFYGEWFEFPEPVRKCPSHESSEEVRRAVRSSLDVLFTFLRSLGLHPCHCGSALRWSCFKRVVKHLDTEGYSDGEECDEEATWAKLAGPNPVGPTWARKQSNSIYCQKCLEKCDFLKDIGGKGKAEAGEKEGGLMKCDWSDTSQLRLDQDPLRGAKRSFAAEKDVQCYVRSDPSPWMGI